MTGSPFRWWIFNFTSARPTEWFITVIPDFKGHHFLKTTSQVSRQRPIRSVLMTGMLCFDAGHHAARLLPRGIASPVGVVRSVNHCINCVRDHNIFRPILKNGQNSLRLMRRWTDFTLR